MIGAPKVTFEKITRESDFTVHDIMTLQQTPCCIQELLCYQTISNLDAIFDWIPAESTVPQAAWAAAFSQVPEGFELEDRLESERAEAAIPREEILSGG